MNWQPIETAPKNGTMILVYANRNGTHLVRAAFWMSRAVAWADGWYSPSNSMESMERLRWYPTDWIPFPVQKEGEP